MNFKPHQYALLIFLTGLLVGASLHYFFSSHNIDYIKEKSYSEGYYDGETNTTKTIIRNFIEADSIVVRKDTLEFYTYDRSDFDFKITSE